MGPRNGLPLYALCHNIPAAYYDRCAGSLARLTIYINIPQMPVSMPIELSSEVPIEFSAPR
jgi:hypothetical protein